MRRTPIALGIAFHVSFVALALVLLPHAAIAWHFKVFNAQGILSASCGAQFHTQPFAQGTSTASAVSGGSSATTTTIYTVTPSDLSFYASIHSVYQIGSTSSVSGALIEATGCSPPLTIVNVVTDPGDSLNTLPMLHITWSARSVPPNAEVHLACYYSGVVPWSKLIDLGAVGPTSADSSVDVLGGASGYSLNSFSIQTSLSNCNRLVVQAVSSTSVPVDSCMVSVHVSLSTVPVPRPVVTMSATPTSGMTPLTVTFIGNASGPIGSEFWNFGEGAFAFGDTVVHTYSASCPATYWAKLTACATQGYYGQGNCTAESTAISVSAPTTAAFGTTVFSPGNIIGFNDQSVGATSWQWNFGDNSIATGSPNVTHTYNVPTCHSASYPVTLTINPYSACPVSTTRTIAVSNSPPAGSAGTAYIILGDLTPNVALPAIDLLADRISMLRAVNAAADRLTASGYLLAFRGTIDQAATRAEFEGACEDANTRVIWFLGHGNSDRQAVQSGGETYGLGDGPVDPAEIRQWRTNRHRLDELTLFACNAGAWPQNAADWNVDPKAVHAPPNVSPTTVPEAYERHVACGPPPAPSAPPRAGRVAASRALADTASFLPMLFRRLDGAFGDSIYGAESGRDVRVVADSSGRLAVSDSAAGVSFACRTVPFDSVDVWFNRYRSTPADTVPAGQISLGAFLLDCDAPPPESLGIGPPYHVSLSYDPARLQASGLTDESVIRVWAFVDSIDQHVVIPAAPDTASNTITFDTSRLGLFLLAAPKPVDAVVASADGGTPFAIWPQPLRDGMLHVRWSRIAPSARPGDAWSISVFDVQGRHVATLARGTGAPPPGETLWDCTTATGTRAAPGTYVVRFVTPGRTLSQRCVLLR